MKLSGIILYVQDVEKLKKFYTQHFQFEVVEEILPSWVLLKSGAAELGLHKAGVAHDTGNITNGENNNAKLVVETEENIVTLRERLKDMQVNMKDIKTWDNYEFWLCDGFDPEGNVFQIKQKK
jgi:catechol 2,3-dioxygenase-like lactoylglutathione lyase family enzyme